MKTAVSVPDELFSEVERLVRRSRRSRSQVYSAALREYVARHSPDDVTEALDETISRIGETAAEYGFLAAATRRVLETTEW